jgi:hypothetical protein
MVVYRHVVRKNRAVVIHVEAPAEAPVIVHAVVHVVALAVAHAMRNHAAINLST